MKNTSILLAIISLLLISSVICEKRNRKFKISTLTEEGNFKVLVRVIKSHKFEQVSDQRVWVQTARIDLNNETILALEVDDDGLEMLRNDTNVIEVEPDHEVSIAAKHNESNVNSQADTMPWGIPAVLQDVNFFKDREARGPVKICVADTGYAYGHFDLPSSYATGQNGAGESWTFDGNGHGTHVSGTICARANGNGVYGIIPHDYNGRYTHISTKAFDASGSGSISTVMVSVQNCANLGADIISLSLGSTSYTSSEKALMDDLYYNKGILLVAAAGNGGNSGFSYPASYPSVISVGSVTSSRQRSPFSQYNSQVELAAPGSDVYSTYPNSQYAYLDGTSMSTPHVAGVAGLLMMFFPNCSAKQIRTVLAYTAQDVGSGGCDIGTGFGLVQAKNAFDRLARGNCGYLQASPNGGCYSIQQLPQTSPPTIRPTSRPTIRPTTRVPTKVPTVPNAEKKRIKKKLKREKKRLKRKLKKEKKKLKKQKKKLKKQKKKLKKKLKKQLKKATSNPSKARTSSPSVSQTPSISSQSMIPTTKSSLISSSLGSVLQTNISAPSNVETIRATSKETVTDSVVVISIAPTTPPPTFRQP